MKDQFKYDVAFSFLEKDKELALAVTDLIRDRVNVFVYPERQNELIGVDGHEHFSQVFSAESRTIVILHREGWGQTPWTRLEETAIKNRGFNDGYDFVTFVPLEDHKVRPKWIPQTRIWPSLDKYGADGLAGIIEDRVRSAGGDVRSESVIDHAIRVERELSYKNDKLRWFKSREGVSDVNREASKIINSVKETVEKIKEKSINLNPMVEERENQLGICCNGFTLVLAWNLAYADILDDSLLHIQIFKGYYPVSGKYWSPEKSRSVLKEVYAPDIDLQHRPGWREEKGKGQFSTSLQLVDYWLKQLLEHIQGYEEKPTVRVVHW